MLLSTLLIFLATSEVKADPAVKFCAGGDILLDRGIRKTIEKHGVDFPFKDISRAIHAHDLSMANLECPVSTSGYYLGKKYSFNSPPEYLAGMTTAGFDIAVVANNHTIDRGRDAFLQTLHFLKESGLVAVGGGRSQKEARKPVIVERKGIKLAFLASVDMLLEGLPFHEDLPAPAWATTEQLSEEIRLVRPKVDFIVVSQHWGVQFQDYPTYNQRLRAHSLIDAGADIIIGHHPHVLQGIEFYRNKPIFYSLGNLIFDQYLAPTQKSILASISFEKGKSLIPIIMPLVLKRGLPAPPDSENQELIIKHLSHLSKPFGTNFMRTSDGYAALPSTPLATGELGNIQAAILPEEVVVFGAPTGTIDRLKVTQGNIIALATSTTHEDTLLFFAIERSSATPDKGNLASVEISSTGISRAFSDMHRLNPWKILLADVDGDGETELCAGVTKTTRFDPAAKNRLFIFKRKGPIFWPQWLGSDLNLEFIDFDFTPQSSEAPQKLLVLGRCGGPGFCVAAYRWNEFGFKGPQTLLRNLPEDKFSGWQKYATSN